MYLSLSFSTNHVIIHAFIDQLISTIKVMKLLKKSFYKAPSTYLQLDYEFVNPGKKNKGYLNWKLTTWEIKVRKFMRMVK
jgi:hypothetical protein